MEQQISQLCSEKSLTLQSLASIRSLTTNPNTSDSTLFSILETLTRSLQFTGSDSRTSRHHVLNLLADLSSRRPHFSPLIFDLLRSDSLLDADALDALASVSDLNPALTSQIDDGSFVSFCFSSPHVSIRLRLLRAAERFNVRPHLLFTLFLGFTKDPYPYVREVALDGLLGLSKHGVFEDVVVVKGCYFRAVELLRDAEDCVRCAAVRVVSEYGRMLVAINEEKNRTDWSDAIFIQLCSMVRDMRMEVRVEAFNALGKVGVVSENILLQTLSKKVLGVTREKKLHSQCDAESFEISASSSAGAFLHGLEDEFYQVRKSACSSLGSLIILSEKFAGEALNLLVDMLNDDSLAVRQQALETMHLMAKCEYLKLQDVHMHMFLGTLLDNSPFVRCAARKILKLVKLPNLELYKLLIDNLLENLKKYPQDEADVFSVLFNIGRSHGKFAVCIIEEVSQEIEPNTDGDFSFDTARVAAYLVLAISVPLSSEKNVCSIPPRVFSYAATLLGRISLALSDVMNQDSLLAYLSQCSRFSSSSEARFMREGIPSHEVISDDPNHTSNEIRVNLPEKGDESQLLIQCKQKEVTTSHGRCELEEDVEIKKSMNLVLAKVKNIWSLVQSGYTTEVLRILRACKEEVLTFKAGSESLESDGALAFTLQYLQVLKLLTKVWVHRVPMKKFCHYELGELELLLGKLDRRLTEIRCRFSGLSEEEELHVLELILVTCLLRLSKVEICCYLTVMRKLSSTMSRVEFLHQQGSIKPSKFVTELKKSFLEIGSSTCGTPCNPFQFNELLNSFFVEQFIFSGRLKHVNAELNVPNNSSENPVIFVSGLPVAIPCEITLYNVLSKDRLWLTLTMNDESTQFLFLDPSIIGDCNDIQKFTYIAPFYRTPKAVCFSLRVCIGMECLFGDINSVRGKGGPKRALANLCKEKEVYLSMASRG